MNNYQTILDLLSEKLRNSLEKNIAKAILKALVELEEEGHSDLAGISNMLTDEAVMEMFDDDEPSYVEEE